MNLNAVQSVTAEQMDSVLEAEFEVHGDQRGKR